MEFIIYSLKDWRLIMEKMLSLLAPKTVAFLICSDENYHAETEVFAGLPVYFGTGHMIEDLYSLAQCDYLIGPPSTYSMWASFYGRVPMCQLPKNHELVEALACLILEDFQIYTQEF
jgi:hypothetical protein